MAEKTFNGQIKTAGNDEITQLSSDGHEDAIASTKSSEISTNIGGYNTKAFANIMINRQSTNVDDFVEVLNTISPEMGGVTNLGVFCDINSVEQSVAVLSDVEEQFIHVETERGEQPYDKLFNDGSSIEPYDFSFNHLLNN
ncbi:MAG: hypothetical protein MJZ41_03140 [Bacteroidaceae bacterium]|nr:hypothetical protein [Bacteroidaceae bacterium]